MITGLIFMNTEEGIEEKHSSIQGLFRETMAKQNCARTSRHGRSDKNKRRGKRKG